MNTKLRDLLQKDNLCVKIDIKSLSSTRKASLFLDLICKYGFYYNATYTALPLRTIEDVMKDILIREKTYSCPVKYIYLNHVIESTVAYVEFGCLDEAFMTWPGIHIMCSYSGFSEDVLEFMYVPNI